MVDCFERSVMGEFLVFRFSSRWHHFLLNNVFHSVRPLRAASSIAPPTFQVCFIEGLVWRGNKRILFLVLSIQNVTDKVSSKYHLSLYTNHEINKKYESPRMAPFYHSMHPFQVHPSKQVLSKDMSGRSRPL